MRTPAAPTLPPAQVRPGDLRAAGPAPVAIEVESLRRANDVLRDRLAEAEDTLTAIRSGAVDALVVAGPHGDEVFTLESADWGFRLFVERMTDGAATLDEEGTITWANRRLASILRLPLERVMGARLAELAKDRDRVVLERALRRGRRVTTGLEVRLGTARRVPVRLSVSPIRSDPSTICAVVVSDLTAQRRRERAIRRSRQQVEEINRGLDARVRERTAELEAFSYSLAHDLRAPLRAIVGFSSILTSEHAAGLDAEGLRLLGVIGRSGLRMNELLDGLLSLSRISHTEMQAGPVAMAAEVRDALAEIRALHPEAQADVVIGPLADVIGDVAMLRQVWSNLLANAFKFTRHRPDARIEISSTVEPTEIAYRVSDNGVGFDASGAERVFGLFARLHNESEFEGTGIGLAIVQRVIARHGGSVTAEGAPGQGATITFRLPRRPR